MKRYTKIFIVFALLTFTLISTKLFFDFKDMNKLQHMVVKDEAKSLLALYMSFRKTYQDIFLDHHIPIDKKTINLLPVRTTDEISTQFSKIVEDRAEIRTVSDRPRNEINRANPLEMNIIDYFNKNPKKEFYFKEEKDSTFYYAQPLYITQTCLKCHGKKEDAIKTVREQYHKAYDYKLGELRGIVSIRISKEDIVENIKFDFLRDLFSSIVVYSLFLLAIYLMIRIIIKNEKRYSETLEKKVAQQVQEIRERDNTLIQQSKMAEMGEMIGNIAHQWRQPLSVISTNASGVKFQNEFSFLTDEILNESMDNIVKNTKYLSQTIDDFRNFIKGDKTIENFSISDNIETTLEILQGTMTHYNIEIIKNIDDKIKIESYPNELTQVLLTIFNNAKDALNEKEPEEKYIFIEVIEGTEKVIISIKDNAFGIKEEIIKKVFDPYFTTKDKSKGTGLGLFMTHRLIKESLNGNIKVQNATFKYNEQTFNGANFIIELPKSIN